MLAARHRARLTMQDRNVDVQEGIRLRNVRRRLFQEEEEIEGGGTSRNLNTGSEDNVVNSFFEEMRKHREEAKERWNFDFEKEIPLEGNFEWVKLDRDRNEIPMNAEVQNKTEIEIEKNGNDELGQLKEDEMTENKIKKENKEKDEEEEEEEEDEEDEGEVPPEGKEVDADDKTESRRQQNRNHSRIVDVL